LGPDQQFWGLNEPETSLFFAGGATFDDHDPMGNECCDEDQGKFRTESAVENLRVVQSFE
jgi:hypothetical protein